MRVLFPSKSWKILNTRSKFLWYTNWYPIKISVFWHASCPTITWNFWWCCGKHDFKMLRVLCNLLVLQIHTITMHWLLSPKNFGAPLYFDSTSLEKSSRLRAYSTVHCRGYHKKLACYFHPGHEKLSLSLTSTLGYGVSVIS